MSNEAKRDKPEIHVNARGGLYVKTDELLRSAKARELLDKAAKILPSNSPQNSPKN